MLIRRNAGYHPHAMLDRRGLLLVTRGWIVATGMFARCWA